MSISTKELDLAMEIGNFFGDYFEEDGKFCIDNGERVFRYDTTADLLKDWVDTLVENHHDTVNNPPSEHRVVNDGWEKEITFIYEKIIGKYPPGIRRYNNNDGTPKWQSYIDVKDPGNPHGKNLHLGTYGSIVDAINARQNFQFQVRAHSISDLDTLSQLAESFRKGAREAREQKPTPEKKLIEAMVEFGLDNLWCDSDIIDALVDCGITYDDFKKHGYGNFVKEYFEDGSDLGDTGSPQKPGLDSVIASANENARSVEQNNQEQIAPVFVQPEGVSVSKELYQAALEHFASDANGIEYIEGVSPENLIYCYENNCDLMDFDFWCRYEELVGEKITYDEYRAIDSSFDGDPYDVDASDMKTISLWKRNLSSYRKNNKTALSEQIHSASERANGATPQATYKTLTNEEFNVLNRIADKTKMDCWFALKQDKHGVDYVWDMEEGKRLSLKTGVGMLVEGLDCKENYTNCGLTTSEEKAFANLLRKLNLSLELNLNPSAPKAKQFEPDR